MGTCDSYRKPRRFRFADHTFFFTGSFPNHKKAFIMNAFRLVGDLFHLIALVLLLLKIWVSKSVTGNNNSYK